MEELTKDEMMNIYGGLGIFDTTRHAIMAIFGILMIKKLEAYIDGVL